MKKKEKIEFHHSLKMLVRTSFFIFAAIFLSKILGYCYRIIVARYFGAEVYGLLSLALMVSGWIGAFALLGIAQGVLRFIPWYRGRKEYANIRYLLKTSTIFLTITGVLSGILMFFLSNFIAINIFHNPNLTIFLQIFSISLPISMLGNLYLSILQAFEKTEWFSFISNVLQNVVRVAFIGFFIFLGVNSSAVAWSYIISVLVVLLASYLVSKYIIQMKFGTKKISQEAKKEIRSSLFAYSWPILFYSVIASFFFWIDTFFIGYYKNAEMVGFYNAAIPIAGLLMFSSDLFMQLFFPLITREYARKKLETIDKLSKQVTKWIFVVNIPIFVVLLVFPGVIINILFGPEYLGAVNALRILSFGMIFASLSSVPQSIVLMAGKSKIVLLNTILFGVVNGLLDILLVPKYGMEGAAIGTAISYALMLCAFLVESKKYASIIPIRKDMIKIFLISLVPVMLMICIKYTLKVNLLILALSGVLFWIVYAGLIFLGKYLDNEDWVVVKAIINKLRGGEKLIGFGKNE